MRTFDRTPNLATSSSVPDNLAGVATDAELVELWLATRRSPNTQSGYRREWRWWRARLPTGLELRELRLVHLRAVLELEPPEAPATRARRIAALRSLLSFAHRSGYLPIDVGAVLAEPRRPDELAERILDLDQVVALLDASRAARRLGARDHALVRLLYVAGCRASELARLDWRHVHPRDDGSASLTVHGKGDKTRHVWISPGTVRELEGLRKGAAEEAPIFRAATGARLAVRDVQRAVTRAAKRAGLPRVSPHWLRHAHATHALDGGAPVHVVAADLGHASVATTTRYLHARPATGSAAFLRF